MMRTLAVSLVMVLVVGCAAISESVPRSPTPAATAAFSIAAPQARQVSAIVQFLAALNSGDASLAETLVSDGIFIGDCDYVLGVGVNYSGRAEFMRWFAELVADGDRIEVDRLFNENPEGNAVGLHGVRRRSVTLSRLGFPRGIERAGIRRSLSVLTAASLALCTGHRRAVERLNSGA